MLQLLCITKKEIKKTLLLARDRPKNLIQFVRIKIYTFDQAESELGQISGFQLDHCFNQINYDFLS